MSISKNQHQFAISPPPSVPRSTFDRTKKLITTFDAGLCIPCFAEEVLPGDTMAVNMTTFFRFATLLKPLFADVVLDVQFYAVPLRLLYLNWNKLLGEQLDPGDAPYTGEIPQMTAPAGGYLNSSLHDYLGLPTQVEGIEHSSLYHRAYYKIWDEHYRDENMQDSLIRGVSFISDGPDDPADFELQPRGKRHDYFTSCLPWPSKGATVELPLGTVAPVVSNTNSIDFNVGGTTDTHIAGNGVDDTMIWGANPAVSLPVGASFGTETGLQADLSAATAATINQLREAAAIQRLLERDARGGNRLPELIHAHFGVQMPEAQWRSEYLGGGSARLGVHEVPQTSQDPTQDTPQGNLAAYATGTGRNIGFNASFVEHSIVLGILSARSEDTHIYQQGIDRQFLRKTRFDFFWPELSNLGEEVVFNGEIYAQGTTGVAGVDSTAFGYQERWSSYRFGVSKVTGQFRSNFAQSLDLWHLSPEFANLPQLGDTFIQEPSSNYDRVVAVPSEPHFLLNAEFRIKHARPIPTRSIPGHTARF